jgi:hypothetical protein
VNNVQANDRRYYETQSAAQVCPKEANTSCVRSWLVARLTRCVNLNKCWNDSSPRSSFFGKVPGSRIAGIVATSTARLKLARFITEASFDVSSRRVSTDHYLAY